MQGYGYSIWAVPFNYNIIQNRYGMKHIPHVTLSTNHIHVPSPIGYDRKVEIKFTDKNLYRLPLGMYEYDPIVTTSTGFYCNIKGYNDTLLHMTIFYDFQGNYLDFKAPDEILDAKIYRADTRSLDPSEWEIF